MADSYRREHIVFVEDLPEHMRDGIPPGTRLNVTVTEADEDPRFTELRRILREGRAETAAKIASGEWKDEFDGLPEWLAEHKRALKRGEITPAHKDPVADIRALRDEWED